LNSQDKTGATQNFHENLKGLMDDYVKKVYVYTKSFPKEEVFGITSQLKRASLSVALNYIEGYARQQKGHFKNFLEISYGSLQESKYLIKLAHELGFSPPEKHLELSKTADKIGAILWGILSKVKN